MTMPRLNQIWCRNFFLLFLKEYELHVLPFKILVHEDIAETLGIYTEKQTSTKLLDYFSDMKYCTKGSPADSFMNLFTNLNNRWCIMK